MDSSSPVFSVVSLSSILSNNNLKFWYADSFSWRIFTLDKHAGLDSNFSFSFYVPWVSRKWAEFLVCIKCLDSTVLALCLLEVVLCWQLLTLQILWADSTLMAVMTVFISHVVAMSIYLCCLSKSKFLLILQHWMTILPWVLFCVSMHSFANALPLA